MAKRVTKKAVAVAEPTNTPVINSMRSAPVATMKPAITEDQIRRRAYEIYLRRNGRPGDPRSDWLQAEAELKGRATR